jgi:molybdopterin-guanine dinucleotide biosynthesis protein A
VDKPALRIGGISLLRRAVDALARARPVVVVGREREGFPDVLWTREDEPGAGPVAALAAGLERLGEEPVKLVVVLAGDLAAVTPSTVDRLVAAVSTPAVSTAGSAGAVDGAVLIDGDGRRQWLLSAWHPEALRAALPDDVAGASLRSMLGGLSIVEVPEESGESADVDTPDDLDRWS